MDCSHLRFVLKGYVETYFFSFFSSSDLVKIIEEDLRGAQDLLPGRVRIFIHYTGISDDEKGGKIPEDLETSGLGILPGRPHVATYLSDGIRATKGGRLAVASEAIFSSFSLV